MLTGSAEICRERTRTHFGFVAWTRWDIDRSYRIASMSNYGLDDRLRVVHILPGSPAADAGLQAGDEIEGVGHYRMPAGKTASAALELALHGEAVAGVNQTLRIRRGNARHALQIVPRPQCDVDLIVTDSDKVGAFIHGRSVYVTHGLMRVLTDDQDIAALAAHFVGHGLLAHQQPSDEDSVAGKVKSQVDELRWAVLDEDEKSELKKVGDFPGTRAFTPEQEMDADRAALELMARAGYPMEVLVEVWHRLVEVDDGELRLWRFHAPTRDRQDAVGNLLTQAHGEARSGEPQPGS
jgi:hypothetical protein